MFYNKTFWFLLKNKTQKQVQSHSNKSIWLGHDKEIKQKILLLKWYLKTKQYVKYYCNPKIKLKTEFFIAVKSNPWKKSNH